MNNTLDIGGNVVPSNPMVQNYVKNKKKKKKAKVFIVEAEDESSSDSNSEEVNKMKDQLLQQKRSNH